MMPARHHGNNLCVIFSTSDTAPPDSEETRNPRAQPPRTAALTILRMTLGSA
jgi:hypothetical protein